MIEFDSPVSYFQNYYNIGTGYASAKLGDNIYLGTNQGLFILKWSDFINSSKSKSYPRLIEGTEGQVWNLTVIDNTLFCGHNNGVFQVDGPVATKISSFTGAWNFLKINNGLIMVGSYTGLYMLEKYSGNWRFRNIIKGFNESSRFVQKDQSGDIWISQTYKGIFRLKCDSAWTNALDVKLFTSKNGLPSEQANLLFRIQSEILVASVNGIYRFNDKILGFERELKYSPYFIKGKQVDYLYEDLERNIWFYADRQLGVLRIQEDGSFKRITIPFSKIATMVIPSFEHINELDPNNVLIGIEGGFANYSSKNYKDYTLPCTIYISELRSGDTSEGVYRYNSKNEKQTVIPSFRYANNTISIAYSANNFELPEVDFQYKLEGFDTEFSDWTMQRFKEYTNLPAGNYTFILHARNNDQVAPSVLSYKFVVLPPWYRSKVALIIYLVLFILGIYLAQRYLSYRIKKFNLAEKQKQKEKYNNRLQVLKEDALVAEKEMERLRNETLNLEMIHKEKELANSTMLLIKKNNTLNKLQTDLRSINSSLGNDVAKNNINSLIKRIDKEIDNEKQWKVFDMHIEQVYEDLFKKLKESYPELTPRELSLCAYLRMNISSKEIATLMNISARGVEISRYRIRKKLHLDREANLTEFMINL
jgi:DNA-binding CsgD family transcriptional regulator